jgi:hypothetical protein
VFANEKTSPPLYAEIQLTPAEYIVTNAQHPNGENMERLFPNFAIPEVASTKKGDKSFD